MTVRTAGASIAIVWDADVECGRMLTHRYGNRWLGIFSYCAIPGHSGLFGGMIKASFRGCVSVNSLSEPFAVCMFLERGSKPSQPAPIHPSPFRNPQLQPRQAVWRWNSGPCCIWGVIITLLNSTPSVAGVCNADVECFAGSLTHSWRRFLNTAERRHEIRKRKFFVLLWKDFLLLGMFWHE